MNNTVENVEKMTFEFSKVKWLQVRWADVQAIDVIFQYLVHKIIEIGYFLSYIFAEYNGGRYLAHIVVRWHTVTDIYQFSGHYVDERFQT